MVGCYRVGLQNRSLLMHMVLRGISLRGVCAMVVESRVAGVQWYSVVIIDTPHEISSEASLENMCSLQTYTATQYHVLVSRS